MSTIKLREVNAIGATPKEFEVEGEIGGSQSPKYVEIELTEDMWDEEYEGYVIRNNELKNSLVLIWGINLQNNKYVYIFSSCLNFVAVNAHRPDVDDVVIDTFNGIMGDYEEDERHISFKYSDNRILSTCVYIDNNGVVFFGKGTI